MTIKDIRATSGLSQAAFAKATGIPARSIENWESGTNNPPAYVLNLLAYYTEHELKGKVIMIKSYDFTDYKGTEQDLDAFFDELYEAESKLSHANVHQFADVGFCDDVHESKTEIIRALLKKHNITYA